MKVLNNVVQFAGGDNMVLIDCTAAQSLTSDILLIHYFISCLLGAPHC